MTVINDIPRGQLLAWNHLLRLRVNGQAVPRDIVHELLRVDGVGWQTISSARRDVLRELGAKSTIKDFIARLRVLCQRETGQRA